MFECWWHCVNNWIGIFWWMRGNEDQWFTKVFLSLIFIKKSHSFFLSLIAVFFVILDRLPFNFFQLSVCHFFHFFSIFYFLYVFSRFDMLDRSVSSEHGFPLSLLSIKKIPDLGDFAEVVTKWLEKLANCMRSGRRRWNVDIIQTSTWSYNFSAQGNFIWHKKV